MKSSDGVGVGVGSGVGEGLGEVQPVGGAAHMRLVEQRIEHDEQVEVDKCGLLGVTKSEKQCGKFHQSLLIRILYFCYTIC